MELLRSPSTPSAHCSASASASAAANQPTATLLFHLQPIFNRKTSLPKLSIFSHPFSHHHFNINHQDYTTSRLNIRRSPPISANGKASPPPPDSDSDNRKLVVVACSAVTIALAIANRVLYKLALVPMKEFPFFLAQLTTFGYVAIYFSTLYMRYNAGTVTDEMLAFPKTPFIIIGFLEALGLVAGMYSGANLPGPAIPILSQAFLVWQLTFSALILGRRYSWNRLAGCFLVAAGVLLAVTRFLLFA